MATISIFLCLFRIFFFISKKLLVLPTDLGDDKRSLLIIHIRNEINVSTLCTNKNKMNNIIDIDRLQLFIIPTR